MRFECIPGHLPSARFPPYGRFACVWLLTCVRSLRNVGFCSFYPPSVAFPGGIFPDSFSYCFGKPFPRCGAMIVTKSICATRAIFTALRNAKSCFSTQEMDEGKKNFPLNYLQKHKHMPEEFESNNLAPWFKLWAPCMKTGRPHTTFP